ncbi:MAG: hypothetical protein VCC04_10810, partial [Myxococcota bacterium]
VDLVLPGERTEQATPEDFPETDVLECVRVGPLPWTRAVSEGLSEAGIAHRVQPDTRSVEDGGMDPARFGGEALYGTWVRPEELDAALAIDSQIFAPLETEAAPEATGDEICPACGAAFGIQAMACPECGLSFS